MADETRVRSAGWRAVVSELNVPVPDDTTFMVRLLNVLGQVSAARQAVLLMPDRTDGEEVNPRPVSVWPSDGTEPSTQIEHAGEVGSAARTGFSSGQSGALFLTTGDPYYSGANAQPCILTIPITRDNNQVSGVITLLVDARSKDAVKPTLAMAEVLAGYTHAHAARMQLTEMRRASFAYDLATRLIASINTAEGFKGAAIQLCNDLAKQFDLDRVGLGWIKGDRTKLVALSDTEHFDRRMTMVQKLEAAMDEAYDQDQPILYPQPTEESDVILSQAVVHAHRELAAGNANLRVASFPLRMDEDIEGVLIIEAATKGNIDLATVEMFQAAMDLIGPIMTLRRSDDRTLVSRAGVSVNKGTGWLIGPKHTAWKLVGVAVIALLIFVSLFHIDYPVTAEASIQPASKNFISMPFDGLLESISDRAEVDTIVSKGEILAELDTTELRLCAADALGKIVQAEKQAEEAIDQGDAGAAGLAQTQADRARSEYDRIEYQITRSRIIAPIDGTIIDGDLAERVGSTLRTGEPLFVIAPLDKLIVVAKVDERDIGLVRGMRDGKPVGTMATKSRPDERIDIEIDRILAVAEAAEGKNVFEARSIPLVLSERQIRELRPGMEGLARIRTERHSLLWIGTRRILDTIRLWLW